MELHIQSNQQQKAIQLARHEHVSVDEIYRRAIDAYQPINMDLDDLEKLLDELIHSCEETTLAVEEAHREVRETLDYFANKRKGNLSNVSN